MIVECLFSRLNLYVLYIQLRRQLLAVVANCTADSLILGSQQVHGLAYNMYLGPPHAAYVTRR